MDSFDISFQQKQFDLTFYDRMHLEVHVLDVLQNILLCVTVFSNRCSRKLKNLKIG